MQGILSSPNFCILTGRKCVVGILFFISLIIADCKQACVYLSELHSPLLQHIWPYFRETFFSFIAVNILSVLFVSLGSEFRWGGQSHPIYLVYPSRAHSWHLMNVYSIVLLEPSTLFPIVLTSVVIAFCILRPIVGSRHALFHFFILPPMLCIDLSVIQISNCCINDKGFPRSSVWRGKIFRKGNSLWC